MEPTYEALEQCQKWLRDCLRLGWRNRDLTDLEKLWWEYHDQNGNPIAHG
jgi:hypothetical protein